MGPFGTDTQKAAVLNGMKNRGFPPSDKHSLQRCNDGFFPVTSLKFTEALKGHKNPFSACTRNHKGFSVVVRPCPFRGSVKVKLWANSSFL